MSPHQTCRGHGTCLNTIGFSPCPFSCRPVKCPNFLLCGQVEPLYLLEENEGICSFCNSFFNQSLEFYSIEEMDECPICMDEEKTILMKMPRCNHHICCSCFRTIYRIYDLSLDHNADRKIQHSLGSYRNKCPICRSSHLRR